MREKQVTLKINLITTIECLGHGANLDNSDFLVYYTVKDTVQTVNLAPFGWLGSIPRWTTKNNVIE